MLPVVLALALVPHSLIAICFGITVLMLVAVLALRIAICVDTNAPALVLVKVVVKVLVLVLVTLVYWGEVSAVPHLPIEILPLMLSPMLPPKNQVGRI
jgi:hypothetical protein